MKLQRSVFLGVALCLTVAGCANGGTRSSDTTGPIKLMQIAPYESQVVSLPFMETAAQAAVDEINDAGGVQGRRLELLTCNEKTDANEAMRCAQKAAQENVTAVVGSLTSVGAQMMPILEKAEIASIGPNAITPADAKSPSNFLFDAGVPGYAAMPFVAKDRIGADTVVSIHIENPAAPTNQLFFDQGADLAGVRIAENIVVPTDAIDFTQYVARAEAAGAQAIVSSLPPEANLKLWNALGSSGSGIKVVASAGSVSPSVIQEAGSSANGSYVVAGTPNADAGNPHGEAFLAAMRKHQPDETVFAGVSLRAYESVHLFADVASTIDGPIDAASVLNAFNSVEDMQFAWVDSLSFTQPGPIADLPRVVSAVTFPSEIVDGALISGEPFDPFESSK